MCRVIVFLLPFLTFGCSTPYHLPEPPPPDQRVSTEDADQTQMSEKSYLEARAAIIQLYGLLEQQRFQEAVSLLSTETIGFLTFQSDSSAEVVLADGKMKVGEELVEFKPVSILLAEDVSQLVDSLPDVEEQETSNRKEIFAVTEESAIRIVMIKESGKWVLHRTRLPKPVPKK